MEVQQAMEGCDIAFHLAAIAKVWTPDPHTFYDVNVSGTINILDAALSLKVKKLVFTSSAAIYGASNGRLLNEQDVRKVPFFTDYETSKFIAEERVLHFVRRGLDAVIVHPTKVYGPGIDTESNAISRIIKSYIEGKWHVIPGSGDIIGNFAYIDDVVNGHLLAAEKGKAGEKYILGGVNVSFNEFFSILKKTSGKNYFTLRVPYTLMIVYAWQQEIANRIFGTDPRVTRSWIRKYNHNLALSSDKAVRELGYKVTPLDAGIANTLAWLGQQAPETLFS
jgi:nucleoside-diphosphate-sugar epimerase